MLYALYVLAVAVITIVVALGIQATPKGEDRGGKVILIGVVALLILIAIISPENAYAYARSGLDWVLRF